MTNGTKRTSDQTFTYAIIRHLEEKKIWKNANLTKIIIFSVHDCGNIHLCVYVNTETGVVWGLRKGNIALVDVSDCQKSNINNIHILINHRKHHCVWCLSFLWVLYKGNNLFGITAGMGNKRSWKGLLLRF